MTTDSSPLLTDSSFNYNTGHQLFYLGLLRFVCLSKLGKKNGWFDPGYRHRHRVANLRVVWLCVVELESAVLFVLRTRFECPVVIIPIWILFFKLKSRRSALVAGDGVDLNRTLPNWPVARSLLIQPAVRDRRR